LSTGNRWLAEAAGRSATYDERWAEMARAGQNVHGEADLVESLLSEARRPLRGRTGGAPPWSVLDAGCGTGRVAIELAARGCEVVGVDADPAMLERARDKSPALDWVQGDLASVELVRELDVVVLAGNVMIFLDPGSEPAVVANLARHLRPGGLLVAGFALEAGRLELAAYDGCATAAGLTMAARWSTWDREPFSGGSYAVSVHRRGPEAASIS